MRNLSILIFLKYDHNGLIMMDYILCRGIRNKRSNEFVACDSP